MCDNQVWFRRRTGVDATAPRGGRRGRPRHRARPEILLLEDRRLMATFVVTDPTDSLSGGVPAPNTLRWAVDQADLATPLRDGHRSGESAESIRTFSEHDSQPRSLHFTPNHHTRPGPRSGRPANGRVPHGTVMRA